MRIGTFEDGRPFEVDGFTYAAKRVAILAMTRKGKSYTSSKICEQMCEEKIPFVVLDPVRAYWGLKQKYENVVIFGDPEWNRTEMPLTEDSKLTEQAELIADLLCSDSSISAIIDMNEWSRSAQRKFATACFWRLYRANKSFRRMVIVEEADIFGPQQVKWPEEIACYDAYDNLVRRGGQRGLGCTTISQRPALVQKSILSQSDITFQLHVEAKKDMDAFADLIANDLKFLTPDEQALPRNKRKTVLTERIEDILNTVKSLPRGVAYVYSPDPDWIGVRGVVKIDKKATYHPGATLGDPDYVPDADEKVQLKKIDVNQVGAALKSILLQRQDQVEQSQSVAVKSGSTKSRGSSVALVHSENTTIAELQERNKKLVQVNTELQALVDRVGSRNADLEAANKTLKAELDSVRKRVDEAVSILSEEEVFGSHGDSLPAVSFPEPTEEQVDALKESLKKGFDEPEEAKLEKPKKAILQFLAMREGRLFSVKQIAKFAGYSVSTSSFQIALSKLSTAGLILRHGSKGIEIDKDRLVDIKKILGEEYRTPKSYKFSEWRAKLDTPEGRIFDVLYSHKSKVFSIQELAEKAGYSPSTSSFQIALSNLSTLDIAFRERGKVTFNEQFELSS